MPRRANPPAADRAGSDRGSMSGQYRIGIDVGGTFTDLVITGPDGTDALHKVPTTPLDVAQGLLAALRESGVPGSAIAEIAHGTTAATNAVLERKGARTGLVTTPGFRDVLELRDGSRRSTRGRQAPFEPLVPRAWRWEAPERLGADGAVLLPLDEAGVRGAGAAGRAAGLEALAVAFLHADRNGAHERRARAILAEAAPELPVILGSAVCPFPDERLRAMTAALAAYLTPLMARYVDGLQRMLDEAGTD
ncbi:MAG: hydantoinase/oxoprolinase family protein, partial [Acidobacteria bacterium]